jgi:hypothetical protein
MDWKNVELKTTVQATPPLLDFNKHPSDPPAKANLEEGDKETL